MSVIPTATVMRAVICRFQLEGMHYWNHFSDPQRHPHRHLFQFTVTVNAASEEAADILNPVRLRQFCLDQFPKGPINFGERQALDIANELAAALYISFEGRGVRVDVTEDGENGAVVTYGVGEGS